MKSNVYFAPVRVKRWDYSASQVAGLERLIEKLDFGSRIAEGEYVAVKTHFGSQGSHRIVRPRFLRVLADAVKSAGGKPFVCDTVCIQGWDYLEVANQNGINPQSVGCPVILADGLFVCDSIEVQAGPVLGSVCVASAIYDTPAMVVVSHCKRAHRSRLWWGDQESGGGRRGWPPPQRRLETGTRPLARRQRGVFRYPRPRTVHLVSAMYARLSH